MENKFLLIEKLQYQTQKKLYLFLFFFTKKEKHIKFLIESSKLVLQEYQVHVI